MSLADETAPPLVHYRWTRDTANPVLPPDPDSPWESTRCMNPFALRVGDEYRLYYSGGDGDGHQRLCLAIAPISSPRQFTRHGVILDVGIAGRFDARWCVLPCVHRIGGRFHMYYSGNEGTDLGLQSFPGIGLAVSDDGLYFERYSPDPVITGDQVDQFPHNRGIAGGGSILEDTGPDGVLLYRMYYTLATGQKSPDVRVDQEKHCAVCHSADGYVWHRGDAGENLVLWPDPSSAWKSEMVEYPCVVPEQDRLRLFYCGNGYGATGIGTAVTAGPCTSP